ncbi:PEP-CTERM sorting domain-containing protein [Salinimonas sp. HHU 13199]|uniref:PEP-CTERM sorting domain-containing protein n=1 Tax=Salinimonas profundi TaxID=2729140 RepID=A0ABR8LPI2_9ALTE|nr:PEP-CTERM sorting domain-containing protein [Salinimonas profundi]MBD3586025.1 PEP-CTERM sorting domain-containing protein [Salinimonas profundi]
MKHLSKILFATSFISATANAGLMYDQNVTPDVIYGGGNANGAFTVDSRNGVELGLRAKLRFDETNQPASIYNSDGAGKYYFDNIAPPTGFGWDEGSSSSAIWNFDFSVNSNVDGSGSVLSDFTYLLEIDYDPGVTTQFLAFDLINQPDADHAIGSDGTGNLNPKDAEESYSFLINNNNVAQNSWNMEFFNNDEFTFTNTDDGLYDIRLSAFDNGDEIASTSIQVVSGDGAMEVPAPATALLMFAGGLMLLRRR